MRSSVHTRRIGAVPTAAILVLAAGACAGSSGPIYELRPTPAPLRYILESSGSNDIETPGGPQGSDYAGNAVLRLEIGARAEGGHAFTAEVESFSFETGGDFGSRSADLTAEVAGRPFRGILGPDGEVTFTETPEFASAGMSTRDLERVVAAILFPLPPNGDPGVESWPHRVTLQIGGGLEGESVYEGSVSLAGDTVWNGVPAAIMVSEGTVSLEGSGQPEGTPAEVEVRNELDTRTVYIWDAERGLLLAVSSHGEGGGEVSAMGFDMPMTVVSNLSLELQAQ